MIRSTRVASFLVPSLFVLAQLSHAGTSPDAQKWIDKMLQAYEKGPFVVGYSAEMNTDQMGQPIALSMTGEATHQDATHINMRLAVSMKMQGQSIDTNVLQVADGETMWIEMDNPLLGGKQVMKISVDQSGQIASNAGGPMFGRVDPVSQIRDLTDYFDFSLGGVADGRVTLNATLKEEARAELADALPLAEAMKEMVVVLDEKTAAPSEMRIGAEPAFITVRISSFEYVDKVDPALFQYSPPEGISVMDLDAALEEAGAAAGG